MKTPNVLCVALAISLIVVSGAFFSSCQKDESTDASAEKFLDLDPAGISGQMSEAQMSVYMEAQVRIDRKVTFTDGKFEMNLRSGREVGISDRLFDYFTACMDAQNRNMAAMRSDGLVPMEILPNQVRFVDPDAPISFILTKSGGVEIPAGGTTNVDFYWSGCDIYLSNSMLRDVADCANVTSAIATLTAFFPAATPASAITALAGSLVSVGANRLAANYPNGVISDVIWLPEWVVPDSGLKLPEVS